MEIFADTIVGNMTILTNGGNGKRGQNGANGTAGTDNGSEKVRNIILLQKKTMKSKPLLKTLMTTTRRKMTPHYRYRYTIFGVG